MKLPPDSYPVSVARRQDIIRRAEQEQLAEIARGDRPGIGQRIRRGIARLLRHAESGHAAHDENKTGGDVDRPPAVG